MNTTSDVSFPGARTHVEAKKNEPRYGFYFGAVARTAIVKSVSTQNDASTQTEIIHCTWQSGLNLVPVHQSFKTEPLVVFIPIQTEGATLGMAHRLQEMESA